MCDEYEHTYLVSPYMVNGNLHKFLKVKPGLSSRERINLVDPFSSSSGFIY